MSCCFIFGNSDFQPRIEELKVTGMLVYTLPFINTVVWCLHDFKLAILNCAFVHLTDYARNY